MTPEEERFNELLSRLKSSSPYPPQAVTETHPNLLTSLDIEIWIMESKEIFYQGGLKGRKKVTSGRPQYNYYPIYDLETLVETAADELWWWLKAREFKYTDCEGPTKDITKLFDQLFHAYDEIAQKIPFMNLNNIVIKKTIIQKPIIKETTITNIRKVIEGWKVKVLKNIKPLKTSDEIKKEFAKLFITHVPEAPPSRIAKCVWVLLSAAPFNVEVNIETFRKDVKKLKEDIEFYREY